MITSLTCGKASALCTLVAMLVLGGCARSPSPRFYTLTPVTSQGIAESAGDKAPRKVVGIAPVEIPDYLDRPEIVSRSSVNRLSLAEFDLWGGSLKADIQRVLTENLSALLSRDGFSVIGWRPGAMTNYRVTLHLTRFDIVRHGKEVLVVAQWIVADSGGKTNVLIGDSSFTEHVPADDLAGAVSGMSSALGRLSAEIAGKIRLLP